VIEQTLEYMNSIYTKKGDQIATFLVLLLFIKYFSKVKIKSHSISILALSFCTLFFVLGSFVQHTRVLGPLSFITHCIVDLSAHKYHSCGVVQSAFTIPWLFTPKIYDPKRRRCGVNNQLFESIC